MPLHDITGPQDGLYSVRLCCPAAFRPCMCSCSRLSLLHPCRCAVAASHDLCRTPLPLLQLAFKHGGIIFCLDRLPSEEVAHLVCDALAGKGCGCLLLPCGCRPSPSPRCPSLPLLLLCLPVDVSSRRTAQLLAFSARLLQPASSCCLCKRRPTRHSVSLLLAHLIAPNRLCPCAVKEAFDAQALLSQLQLRTAGRTLTLNPKKP